MKKFEKRKRRLFKKKVRNIIYIILVLILIFNMTMVDAGSNDSVIERNRVDGIYAVTNIQGVNRIFYLNMYTLNGRIAYCIELGVDITSDIYNSTYDFKVSNLTDEQIKYIKDISYFGYGYDNHNDINYYMAAQELIWEYLTGYEIEWVNTMDVNGERIDIDEYKNEIMLKINDYYKGINLSGYVDEMEVNIGDKLVISDNNENLKYYEIIGGEHCEVSLLDNSLYFKFDTDYVGQIIIKLKRKQIYDYDINLYYQGDSQKLISDGNVDDVLELKFNVKGKDIHIKLRDSVEIKSNGQFNYKGICYELFSDDYKYFGRFESDAEGNIVINNMPYGKYYIRGIGVNRAYYFENIDNYFNFVDDSIIYLEVCPFINELQILKLYGDGENLEKEMGVMFEIYNYNGSFYMDFVTNDDGMSIVNIPYGKYIVKQKTTTNGYLKVEDFELDLTKRKNDKINYTLVDKMIKSNLIIRANNEEGNSIVEEGIYYMIRQGDNYINFNGDTIFESYDGVMMLPFKLAYGDYVIEIVNNSSNYECEIEKIELNINDNSNFIYRDNELWIELDVSYNLKKGKVKIITFQEEIIYEDNSYYYDNRRNSNVSLDVVAAEDIIVNNNVVYRKGDVVENFITDNNGEYFIEDIYFGKYYLLLGEEKRYFEVNSKMLIEIEIGSSLKKGNIKIHNMTSDMENIIGTTIELLNEKKQVIYIGVTNDEGIIKINDLAYGNYCIKEKNVHEIYLINEDEICFSVTGNEETFIEIINKKRGKQIISVPNTFSDKKSINKLMLLIVMVLVGGIIYKIKSSNKIC